MKYILFSIESYFAKSFARSFARSFMKSFTGSFAGPSSSRVTR